MPPEPSPFVAVFRSLDQAFSRAGTRWYLFGAQAALLYGAARLTADVDVTVLLGATPVNRLVEALAHSGCVLRVSDPQFIERTRVLPVVHRDTGILADVVLAGPGLEELFMSRARVHVVEELSVPVARPEDLIAMKVLAGRPKDLDDVRAVVAANRGTLDVAMIRDTLALIEGALGQSDLVPVFEELWNSRR